MAGIMAPVNAGPALLRMLAVVAVIAVFIAAMLGLNRLLTPDHVGFTPDRLAASVVRDAAGESPERRPAPCKHIGTTWSCFVPDGSSEGGARYRVQMQDSRCWTAEKVVADSDSDALPEHADDCIKPEDVID
jgi:hypothetical protein